MSIMRKGQRNEIVMFVEEVNKITTKEEFINFLNQLIKDFKKNPEQWENRDIESFLQAMSFWIEDMDGFYSNMKLPKPESINWSFLASALCAASVYE